LAKLIRGVDRDRLAEVAFGDLLRRLAEAAPAAQNPTSDAPTKAIAPAIRIWRRIRATLSSTSARGLERTATHSVPAAPSIGTAEVPTRFPATVSTPEVTSPSAAAASAER